jgi:hypothetical protein
MKFRLVINGEPVAATLYDNSAAHDFHQLLPLQLVLQDYASAEKIAYLPRKIDIAGAPPGFQPSAGDLAYYAPWGNLALFYRDQPYATGLVSLGRIDSGANAPKVAGTLRVRIEAVK